VEVESPIHGGQKLQTYIYIKCIVYIVHFMMAVAKRIVDTVRFTMAVAKRKVYPKWVPPNT
jgi:hypothetical protein